MPLQISISLKFYDDLKEHGAEGVRKEGGGCSVLVVFKFPLPLSLSLPPSLPLPPSSLPPLSPLPPSLPLSFLPLPFLPPPTQLLEREYGPYLVSAESGYDISVQFDYDSLPEDKGSVHMYLCVCMYVCVCAFMYIHMCVCMYVCSGTPTCVRCRDILSSL